VERLKHRATEAASALASLREVLMEPYSAIVRDAAIQRFEYTFEVIWKLLQAYLHQQEGLLCSSPKACFREAFATGLLSEDETMTFLQMTDDRSLTVHTYKQALAQAIYRRIQGYYEEMQNLYERITHGMMGYRSVKGATRGASSEEADMPGPF